jgi:hypothetical protein
LTLPVDDDSGKNEKPLWENELNEILNHRGDKSDLETRVGLLISLVELNQDLVNPREQWREALNQVFNMILSKNPMPVAIIQIFKLGILFSMNKDFLDSLGGET